MIKYVYILYARRPAPATEQDMLGIYRIGSYQKAYDRIADIAERYGNAISNSKYPSRGQSPVVIETVNADNGQRWWIEKHEVL